jgi:O-succinylbenzoate synthase
MKIRIHRYQLPWSSRFSRNHTGQGALLSVNFDGGLGYADLHPWPSLGDQSLDEQLELLRSGKVASQLQRSLDMAQKDALSRQGKMKKLQYLAQIRNHNLILEKTLTAPMLEDRLKLLCYESENPIFKWKISPETTAHTLAFLNNIAESLPNLHWRLDANGFFSFADIANFWNQLSSDAKKTIQFIEDPCRYDESDWNRLDDLGMPLAIDFETNRWKSKSLKASPTDSGQIFFVFKPAVQDLTLWAEWLHQNPHRFLLTSYLDHPVGLLHALWTAEAMWKQFPDLMQVNGLNLPISLEEVSAFWPGLHRSRDSNAHWEGVSAGGIGFDQRLENLEWVDLGKL